MSLVHFDIPAKDIDKIKQFYQGVFGWRFEKTAGESENWSIDFESDGQQRHITGGIIPRSAPTQPIGCHFLVSSVEETVIKIKELGGVVFVPRTTVQGKGYYACCLDPEDNYFILWEDDPTASLN